MNLNRARYNVNPILTNMIATSVVQGNLVAEKLFPRLPQALRGMTLPRLGSTGLKKVDTRRAPGATTAQVKLKWDGRVYTLDQHSVEVPIPRELMQEADTAQKLNVGANIDISEIAMATSASILATGYEIEAAALATDTSTYDSGNVLALTGTAKYSTDTGTPVTDLAAASEIVRKKCGRRPNRLQLSADTLNAVSMNKEVRSYLPSTQMGAATLAQLATIFKVQTVEIAEGIWVDEDDKAHDIWTNNAILSYTPGSIQTLADASFGFTSVLPEHPFGETPYYDSKLKSWVYGATFERRANLGNPGAGFLITNLA